MKNGAFLNDETIYYSPGWWCPNKWLNLGERNSVVCIRFHSAFVITVQVYSIDPGTCSVLHHYSVWSLVSNFLNLSLSSALLCRSVKRQTRAYYHSRVISSSPIITSVDHVTESGDFLKLQKPRLEYRMNMYKFANLPKWVASGVKPRDKYCHCNLVEYSSLIPSFSLSCWSFKSRKMNSST